MDICYFGDQYYNTIEEAIMNVTHNSTIVVIESSKVKEEMIINGKNITIKGVTGKEIVERDETFLSTLFRVENNASLL